MKLQSIVRNSVLSTLAVVVLLSLTSCIDEAGISSKKGDGDMMLTLTVLTGSNAGSRSRGHTDDSEESGSDVENNIDFSGNDFRVILFDNEGNYLYDFTPKGAEWAQITVGASLGYRWEGQISFLGLSEDKIDEIKTTGYQVLAVANWRSFDNQKAYGNLFSKANGHQSLSEIWSDNENYNFTYKPLTGSYSWRPAYTSSSHTLIPMFGLSHGTAFVSQSDGLKHSYVSISMQRAVAKIEIIDNLASQQVSITEAVMTRYNTTGRYITDVEHNPNWDKIGSQVDVSSLPADVTTATELKFFREIIDASHSRWVAYVPEMLLETPIVDAEGNFDGARTHVDIKVSPNSTGYEGGTYQVHFGQYDPLTFKPTIPDDSWNHILRNHIYRFYINRVNLGPKVDLHLHVIPWNVDDEEIWDFTDNVTVTKNIVWTAGTYESIDEQGNVNLSFDEDLILEGRFRIISPINGKWHAYLTMLPGSKSDAITFVDKDGEPLVNDDPNTKYSTHAQGEITGNDQDIILRIMPTNFDNDVESRYRLEIYVENFGKWTKVALVESDDFDDYIIVRKANLIQP